MPARNFILPGEPRQGLLLPTETKRGCTTPVACLFVRQDSIYKSIAGADCYDATRDARTWPGGCSMVAHPPCRKWGSMRQLSTAPESERELAIWAIEKVRVWGGVVEHPAASNLWDFCRVPRGQCFDAWGGYSIAVDQWHFGHDAAKPTRLYIVGCPPGALPPIPWREGVPGAVVCAPWGRGPDGRRVLNRHQRERTPELLASWLVTVARRAGQHFEASLATMRPEGKQCPVCEGFFIPRTRGRPSTYCNAGCRLIGFRRGRPEK